MISPAALDRKPVSDHSEAARKNNRQTSRMPSA
jgi:hypothetical protein